MTILEKIRIFLRGNHEISIGYNGLTFFSEDKLDEGQVGYSIDKNNNSFLTGQEGDWKEEWLVIGVDSMLGDPILVDTSSRKLQIFTAVHGEGGWETISIADSLDSFFEIISELNRIGVDRGSPVELEENPISDRERKRFFQKVKNNNSKIEFDYWENFLEDE